jgi:hypothetical protein
MPTSEYGLCRCGCGQPTPLAEKTRSAIGHVRGEPLAYLPGHQNRSAPLKIGERFGRWLVIGLPQYRASQGTLYPVRCDCGTQGLAQRHPLTSGKSKSCGCLDRELAAERARVMGKANVRHGMTGTPTHRSWQAMLVRCSYEKHPAWHRYGGRGITVCDLWQGPDGFQTFFAFMGERPEGMTLDRMDNDRGYFPANCRWATPTEQQRNRSAR